MKGEIFGGFKDRWIVWNVWFFIPIKSINTHTHHPLVYHLHNIYRSRYVSEANGKIFILNENVFIFKYFRMRSHRRFFGTHKYFPKHSTNFRFTLKYQFFFLFLVNFLLLFCFFHFLDWIALAQKQIHVSRMKDEQVIMCVCVLCWLYGHGIWRTSYKQHDKST